jgi:hypothetical protein
VSWNNTSNRTAAAEQPLLNLRIELFKNEFNEVKMEVLSMNLLSANDAELMMCG